MLFRQPQPIPPLPVAMVQASCGSLLFAEVRRTSLLQTCCGPASRAAIALAAITPLTDPEYGSTAKADPLEENRFPLTRHSRSEAGLDKGNGSWHSEKQLQCIGDPLWVANPSPPLLTTAGALYYGFPPE